MKKKFFLVGMVVAICMVMAGTAMAKTATLPKGVVVSATVDSEGIATVTISGVVPENVQYYSYEGVKDLGPVSEFKIDLRNGRQFSFTFGDGSWALLTPEMAYNPWAKTIFGKNIGLDCCNPNGCCFLITASMSKK